jgi:hypothetical protein
MQYLRAEPISALFFAAKGHAKMTKKNDLPFALNEVDVEVGDGNVRSQANETADGLDLETEVLRHATEDTPSGALPEDIEKTPVFDRGDANEKI